MITRYITLGEDPELFVEQNKEQTDDLPQLELSLPIDMFWDLQEAMKQYRYAKQADLSTAKYWERITKLAKKYITNEKDRQWFNNNIGG